MANYRKDYLERKDVQALAELVACNPFAKQQELAEMVGKSRGWINRVLGIPGFDDLVDKASNVIWQKSKIKSMRTMEALAMRGNYKANEFILRANGINPEQRVAVADDIVIDIKKDEGADN